MNASTLLLVFEGFEEIEAITPIDILRRAGVEVTIASLGSELLIKGRNGITIQADTRLNELIAEDFDCLLLPGGPGVSKLRANPKIVELAQQFGEDESKLVAAICASPTLLHDAGLLKGREYTAHFSMKAELSNINKGKAVVEDGNIITSQGAGTATRFALAVAARLTSKENADKIAESICMP